MLSGTMGGNVEAAFMISRITAICWIAIAAQKRADSPLKEPQHACQS